MGRGESDIRGSLWAGPPTGRDRVVAARCGQDLALRQEVERLLASSATQADFIENSPFEGIAARLASHGRFTGSSRGHYQLGDRVASGGIGEVYGATDLLTGQTVAIKVLTVDDESAGERLKREAAHASELDHPEHLQGARHRRRPMWCIYRDGVSEGTVLLDAVPGSGFEPTEALGLLLQLASAIEHAHARGSCIAI